MAYRIGDKTAYAVKRHCKHHEVGSDLFARTQHQAAHCSVTVELDLSDPGR